MGARRISLPDAAATGTLTTENPERQEWAKSWILEQAIAPKRGQDSARASAPKGREDSAREF
jgi:hypothetical protein